MCIATNTQRESDLLILPMQDLVLIEDDYVESDDEGSADEGQEAGDLPSRKSEVLNTNTHCFQSSSMKLHHSKSRISTMTYMCILLFIMGMLLLISLRMQLIHQQNSQIRNEMKQFQSSVQESLQRSKVRRDERIRKKRENQDYIMNINQQQEGDEKDISKLLTTCLLEDKNIGTLLR